jgi:Tfp pilus assembly protein PilF
MFLPTGRATTAHRSSFRFLQILSVSLLLLIPLLTTYAQGGRETTGTGGQHKIQGRIYFPSGRRSDATSVKVTLESSSSERLFVLSDLNGSFTFQSLAPGSYYLTVEAGKDYEPARESVVIESAGMGAIRSRSIPSSEIARANIPRTFNVIFNLRLKRGVNADAKPGVYDVSLANLPKPAVEAYQNALESVRAGDRKKAVQQLREAISYYPEFTLALNELGVQYLKLGQADKAIEVLRSALRIKPDEFMPRLNYGIALLEKKQMSEAEAQLRQAVKLSDTSWAAHMYLGITLISVRKFDEAEKELQRTLALAGDNLSLPHYYLGGIYWRRGDHKLAADELEKYLQLAPKSPEAERIRATIKELRDKK